MSSTDTKIVTMKIPFRAQGSEDRLFLWLRDRYLENRSEEDLKDIERLAGRNMRAAYWMSKRLAEMGDDEGARE